MRAEWTLKTVRDRCEIAGECWLWKQSCGSHGYPQACINGRTGRLVRAHVYKVLLDKPVPKGYCVTARCGDRLCCSPECLVIRTRSKINVHSTPRGPRSVSTRIRHRASLEANGRLRLTQQIADEIRAMPQPVDRDAIGRTHGVSASTVGRVLRREIWALTPPTPFAGLGVA